MAVDINKFTNDFVTEWNGRKLNVNGAHVNFDGRYGIQCMDLWNYWWTELGIPVKDFPRHVDAAAVWEDFNGKHYTYFDGILPDKPARKGDVFIYNRKAWGTGYGHIGIVISDNGNGTITVLETNGLGDGYEDDWMNQYGSAPRIHTWPKTNLYGYLRFINTTKEAPVAIKPGNVVIDKKITDSVLNVNIQEYGPDAVTKTGTKTVAYILGQLNRNWFTRVFENHKKILKNQDTILANQKKIMDHFGLK